MKRLLGGAALAALLAMPTAAAAQRQGAFEVGAFGQATWFDDIYDIRDGGGAGARLGFFILPNLAIEGDIAWVWTEERAFERDATYNPWAGRLVYNIPTSRNTAVLIGAGYTQTNFDVEEKFGQPAYDASESAFGGLLGVRFGVRSLVNIRLDFLADYVSNVDDVFDAGDITGEDESAMNYSFRAGLSLLLNNKPPDSDKDGVPDEMDNCPGTPMGVTVDEAGCPIDGDGDGVADYLDRCPNTPAGVRVNAEGCPLDSDGDGVTDDKDRCANTPRGDKVDANGCSLPKDDDGDGVTNDRDRCPATPAGVRVDANGCPLDSDGDGVSDDRDRCPNTAAGTQVDANGCPILFRDNRPTLILEGVNFETNKATLTQSSRAILLTVAQALAGNPDVRVEVGGHTDSQGAAAYNQNLSQQRAESVMNFLIENGVSAGQLTAKGYGEEVPVASNANAEGRASNRRVELKKIN